MNSKRRRLLVSLGLLDDSNEPTQRKAILALGGLGPGARPAVTRLLELGRSTNFGVLYQAVRTLGFIGEGAAETVPALREWSRDSNNLIRMASAEAPRRISPEGAFAFEESRKTD